MEQPIGQQRQWFPKQADFERIRRDLAVSRQQKARTLKHDAIGDDARGRDRTVRARALRAAP